MRQSATAMTYDEATARLVALARLNGGGTVTAAQVEGDPVLAENREIVYAAARALGGGTNVFSYLEDDDGREWFPFSGLKFTALSGGRLSASLRRVLRQIDRSERKTTAAAHQHVTHRSDASRILGWCPAYELPVPGTPVDGLWKVASTDGSRCGSDPDSDRLSAPRRRIFKAVYGLTFSGL